MFDPKTLATTISVTLSKTANRDETSSGIDVPTPTMVIPMRNGDIPKEKPIFSADSSSQSALLTRKINEMINMMVQIISMMDIVA